MGARSGGRTRPAAGRTGGPSTTISTVPTDAPSPSGPAWKPDTQTTSPSPAVDCRQRPESTSHPSDAAHGPFGPAVESLLALLQWTARQGFSDGNHKRVNAPLIKPLERSDFDSWQQLWHRYLRFYRAKLPDQTTTMTFK